VGIDLSQLGDMEMMGMAWDPIWRSYVTVDTYVRPIAALLFIVTLAVLYPALRAAFIRPIEAMRSQ
jgi:ABC-type antimicrobial peptide transport system permease subunit